MKNTLFLILTSTFFFLGCSLAEQNTDPATSVINEVQSSPEINACGCLLTDREMRGKLPITAVGDSIIICKTGPITLLQNEMIISNWQDYMKFGIRVLILK